MDSGEQILRYYLKVFSIFIILFISIFFYSAFILKKNNLVNSNVIEIEEGDNLDRVLKNFKQLNNNDKFFFKLYYKINSILLAKYIHYGKFYVTNEISFYDFFNIITRPSNILNSITVIDGWSKNDLNQELSKYFNNYEIIEYEDILADTYFFNNNDFESFKLKLENFKKSFFENIKYNNFFDNYSYNDLMIIGSLIEKEGLDYEDKRNISSVILNRLKIGMKLQIDATVLFAVTDGKYNLKRKLLLKDLKIDNPYNTYKYPGLPPKPISYVSPQTLKIILENYQTEFLFYFFNNSLNKHIFSKNFEEHKNKLYEYRSQK